MIDELKTTEENPFSMLAQLLAAQRVSERDAKLAAQMKRDAEAKRAKKTKKGSKNANQTKRKDGRLETPGKRRVPA